MANNWNHHKKHGTLESLPKIVMDNAFVANYYARKNKTPELMAMGARIKVRSTACNYGGLRFWFACAGCGGNRLVLRYLESQNNFYCNKCLSGVHRITQMSKLDRRYNRRAGIREKLGLQRQHGLRHKVTYCDKPKGMHWKTFEPLMKKHNDLIAIDDKIWLACVARIVPDIFR